MDCKRCKGENPSYYNYCKDHGEDLNGFKKKFNLKNGLNSNCIECGSAISSIANYCKNCGKILSKTNVQNDIPIQVPETIKESSRKSLSFSTEKLSCLNFNNLNLKLIVASVGLTIVLTSIVLALLNGALSDLSYDMLGYEDILPSKFKVFTFSLAYVNSLSLGVSLKMAFANAGNADIAVRHIVYPILVILAMYISSRICLNKETPKEKVLENSIAIALVYSIAMFIIGIVSSYSINIEEGISVGLSINLSSLFINSLIIGLVGAYLGISKDKELGTLDTLFKKAMKIVIVGFTVTTLTSGVVLYYLANQNNILSEIYYDEYASSLIFMLTMAILLIGSWLFTLSNFASISLLGTTSYNIITLSSKSDKPIILLVLIPIILLILVGRKLKDKYGENLKIATIFSGMYALVMTGFAYFTRFVFSVDASYIQDIMGDGLYDLISEFSYGFADTAYGYVDSIYNSLSSGSYIGPNLFSVIVASFIFSFICIFIGYKTKKV